MTNHRAGFLISFLLMTGVLLSSAFGQENTTTSIQKPDDESVYAEIMKAPEKARNKRNPLAKDPDAVGAGRILFGYRCAECHGDNAEGGKKGPSLRVNEIQDAEAGAIFWVLTNGVVRKGMPVWSKLPEPQRWQLVTFIKSLGLAPTKSETSPANSRPPLGVKDSTSRHR